MKRVFFIGWLIFLIFWNIGLHAQIVREWVGPVNGTWNTLGNWAPASPINEARLEFKGVGLSPSINNTAFSFSGLIFSGGRAYTINTNTINLLDNSIGSYGRLVNQSDLNQTINATINFNDFNKHGVIYDSANGFVFLSGLTLGNDLSGLLMFGENPTKSIAISGPMTGSKMVTIGLSDSGILKPNSRVWLGGNNSAFSGGIKIQSGVLHLANSNAMGSSVSNSLEVMNGTALELSGGINLGGKSIYIDGSGIAAGGAIVSAGGANTISSNILLNSSARIANRIAGTTLTLNNIGRLSAAPINLSFDTASNNSATVFGNITVNGTIGMINGGLPFLNLNKEGNSTLTINGNCNYTGYTGIGRGTLQLGGNNLLPATSVLDLFNNSCIFRTGSTIGYSQRFSSLAITARNNHNNPRIDLGTGSHKIIFGNSRNQIWWQNTSGRRLTITGWVPAATGDTGIAGRIFVEPEGPSIPGLTQWQLDKILITPPIGYPANEQGAKLLPSGELVPSTTPLILSLSANIPNPITLLVANAGFIGSRITINGARLNLVTGLTIGGNPVSIVTKTSSAITFVVDVNTSGTVTVTSPVGDNTFESPLVNLGYITTIHNRNWLTNTDTWLRPISGTPIYPSPGKTVTIGNGGISLNGIPANMDTLKIISSIGSLPGQKNPAYLQLLSDRLINSTTHLVGFGGQLRLFNSASISDSLNVGALPGVTQDFNSLTLNGKFSICLGKGNDSLKFAPSNLVAWSPGASLTIFNWEGIDGQSGSEGKIFFGDTDTTLTNEQLLQIAFNGRCGGAKLLSTGELVPSDDPFFTTVVSNFGSAAAYTGYIGSTVTIKGCNMSTVNKLKIGSWELDATDMDVFADSVKFVVSENTPNDFIQLITIASDTFKSRTVFRNMGYINQVDGNWSVPATWLGNAIPLSPYNVTIGSGVVNVDMDVLDAADSLTTISGATLQWGTGKKLVVTKAFINRGTTIMPLDAVLEMNGPGVFTNTGDFSNLNEGTVIFNNTITITGGTGVMATTFNNLILNAGVLSLPANATMLPIIKTLFTINGGSIVQSGQLGPLYRPGSKLVYASGANYSRGVEWNASNGASSFSAGLPVEVVVENGTILNLNATPNVMPAINPARLKLNGDLLIKSGKVINNMGRPLEVFGNLYIGNDNSSFSELELNASLYLWKSFIKYVNSTFTANSQEVYFSGNQSDSIAAVNHPDPSDPSNIVFGSINFSKNADITLKTSIQATANIHFNLGKIYASSDRFIQMGTMGTSTGGNITSFVDGPMKKQIGLGSNDFEFKIGKVLPSSVYKPVQIADLQPDGTTTFTAEYFPTSTTALPTFSGPFFVDPVLTGIWANEWWDIGRSGTGKARVGIYYLPLAPSSWEPTAPCSDCNVGVVHYNSITSTWEFTKASGNFNNATPPFFEAILNTSTGLVYSDVETNFSPFTIGFSFPSVLPIKLTHFSAQLQHGNGLIKWEVSDIGTVKQFELEHSTDGIRFQRLSTISPSENNAFNYLDINLTSGIHYYRLKMFEKNGRYTFSRIEWIQVGAEQTIISGLLQNPVGGGQATVKLYSATTQTAEAMVVDRSGRVMLRQGLALQKGNNQLNISVLPLSPGGYFLKLRTKDGVEKVMPFLK